MLLTYKEAVLMAKTAGEYNPYATYNTLLKYHATGPDEGLTPEESARKHLLYELALAMARQPKLPKDNVFSGRLTFAVPASGQDAVLGDRLASYSKAFYDTYRSPLEGIGPHRIMSFGANGTPVVLQDADTGTYILHNSVNSNKLTPEERLAKFKKLQNDAVFHMALLGAQQDKKASVVDTEVIIDQKEPKVLSELPVTDKKYQISPASIKLLQKLINKEYSEWLNNGWIKAPAKPRDLYLHGVSRVRFANQPPDLHPEYNLDIRDRNDPKYRYDDDVMHNVSWEEGRSNFSYNG